MNNRKYHAKMHFIRIHLNNGNPMVLINIFCIKTIYFIFIFYYKVIIVFNNKIIYIHFIF